MDTEDMMEKLMHIERAPIRQLEARKEVREMERELWGQVNTQLSSFNSVLAALRQSSTFTGRRVDTGEDVLEASATDRAELGNYGVRVDRLATSHRIASTRFDSLGESMELEGSFDIFNGTERITAEVEASDSLADLRDSINGLDAGVRASVVDNHLVLTSSETGSEDRILLVDGNSGILAGMGIIDTDQSAGDLGIAGEAEVGTLFRVVDVEVPISGTTYQLALEDPDGKVVAVSEDGIVYHSLAEPVPPDDIVDAGTSGDSFEFFGAVDSGVMELHPGGFLAAHSARGELEEGVDALFSVDGIEIVSSRNEGISDVIPGVTLHLGGLGEADLSIGLDSDRTVGAIERFVEEYNSLGGFLSGLGDDGGILQGDSTLIRLQNAIRRGATDPVASSEAGGIAMLSQIGITVDRDGVMSLDSSILSDALREDPSAVEKLFSARESDDGFAGVSRRLDEGLRAYLRYGDGILASRDRMYDRVVSDIDSRIESTGRRLERREESLRRQFTQLERMLSDMQSQGQWLQGQIDNLSGRGGSG